MPSSHFEDTQAILPAEEALPEESISSLSSATLQVHVYKRRWWILFLFASMGFLQCAVWNTWGPITESVKFAYATWTNSQIALISMWGTLTMIVGLIPITLLLQLKGLRVTLILSVILMAGGTSIRCVTMEDKPFTALVHAGAVLNGFAGIAISAAPSMLSSRWFPPHERTIATAIGCTFNQLGNAGGFFLGPWLVPSPHNHSVNSNTTLEFYEYNDQPKDQIRRNIMNYMYITAGLCTALLICVSAYFPDKPPKHPSLSSSISVPAPIMEDLKKLLTNKSIWMMVIPYGITLGINVAWSSVLDINLAPFGISQDEAGILGVYVTFGGVILAIVAAKFSDLFSGHLKLTIIFLMLVATGGYSCFLCIVNNYLPFNKYYLYLSVIIGASFNYACSPLFFELAAELAYPVPAGVIGGFLAMCWNVVGAIFLLTMQAPITDVLWMDYLLAAQGLFVVIMMCFLKVEYLRSAVDKLPENLDSSEIETDEGEQA